MAGEGGSRVVRRRFLASSSIQAGREKRGEREREKRGERREGEGEGEGEAP